jgi:hypothetical protein
LLIKQNLAPSTRGLSYKFDNPDAKMTIPFELSRNGVFFQVRVNNSNPLWLIIDSGSAANYIDLTTADKIGLISKAPGQFAEQARD